MKLLNNLFVIGKLVIEEINIKWKYNWYLIDFILYKYIFINGLYLKNELGLINKIKDIYFSYFVNDNNFDIEGNLKIF